MESTRLWPKTSGLTGGGNRNQTGKWTDIIRGPLCNLSDGRAHPRRERVWASRGCSCQSRFQGWTGWETRRCADWMLLIRMSLSVLCLICFFFLDWATTEQAAGRSVRTGCAYTIRVSSLFSASFQSQHVEQPCHGCAPVASPPLHAVGSCVFTSHSLRCVHLVVYRLLKYLLWVELVNDYLERKHLSTGLSKPLNIKQSKGLCSWYLGKKWRRCVHRLLFSLHLCAFSGFLTVTACSSSVSCKLWILSNPRLLILVVSSSCPYSWLYFLSHSAPKALCLELL